MPEEILLVEDEPGLRFFLHQSLEEAGHPVSTAAAGEEALSLLQEHSFAVALVDLRLPDISGLKLAQRIQESSPDTVVIILTAHGTMESAIEALRQEVYDYLLKPVSLGKLRASVEQALLRYRRQRQQRELVQQMEETSRLLRQVLGEEAGTPSVAASPTLHQAGDLVLDEKGYTAWWKGQPLSLTSTEFALLAMLAREPGTVVSCAELVQQIHGYEAPEPYARDLIKPHVYRLRQKIEADESCPQHLLNVRGRGYKFVP